MEEDMRVGGGSEEGADGSLWRPLKGAAGM